jgi:8-oxo-dGTP pyrophosphatase MutT (NUDIX family)
MSLKMQIEQYEPFNEQEEKDKEFFLNYIDKFYDVLTRSNELGHFSGSAFIVNKARTKALMVYHNIFNSWACPGGHADGVEDLMSVAIKEAEEETGIKQIIPLVNGIFAIQSNPTLGHFKKGKYVSAHIHFDVTFLFEANDTIPIRVKEDENSNVTWIPIEECVEKTDEDFMREIHKKVIEKLQTLSL